MLAVVRQVEGGAHAGRGGICLVLLGCHIVGQGPQHVTCMAHRQLQTSKQLMSFMQPSNI